MAINPTVVEAFRLIAQIVGLDRLVVIGATVPTLLIDLRYSLANGRATLDVDAVVNVESWDAFKLLRENLIAAGFAPGRPPHRFLYKGFELDLIPYSRQLAPNNRLRWPDDTEMNTMGLEEAFECAMPTQFGDFVVPMVTVAGSVLLKFISYSDRPAERQRDVADILHSLEHYGGLPDEARFDLAGTGLEVQGQPVTYEEAGAYLLGREVAQLGRPESLRVVRDAIARLFAEQFIEVEDDTRRSFQRRLLVVFDAAVWG